MFKKSIIVLGMLAGLTVSAGLMSTDAQAAIRLLGGIANGLGSGNDAISSISPMLGVEMTLGAMDIVDVGVAYDHVFLPGNEHLAQLGLVGRLGLGPVAGLFVDGKAGVSFATLGGGDVGFGLGAGIGYRIGSHFAPRVGVRVIGGIDRIQMIGDLGLMFTF